MCGISGVLTRRMVDPDILDRMNGALQHRGPDQSGTFVDAEAGVHFAHRRLSIIDLSDRGRQPMTSACGRFIVVYNGELYNYVELRQALSERGRQFRSTSDTEVLLHAYAEWGRSCLHRFNGMFAFAIYDMPAGKVFVARDPIGEKPFYYVDRPELFAFASEVKAFRPLRALGLDLDVDPDRVVSLLGYMWVPERTRTLLKHVRRLEPGHWGEFDLAARTFHTEPYWTLRPRQDGATPSFDEAAGTYGRMLDESVRLRLRADVPVAVMLSGGLDSSVVAALARRHVQDLRTFTLVFNRPDSEGPFAATVARHIGSRHQELAIDTTTILDTLHEMVPTLDDLTTVDGGLITTCMMARVVREQGVKVVLLGEGSDELNAGYDRFRFSTPPFAWMPRRVRHAGFYHAMSRYPVLRRGFWRHAADVSAVLQSYQGDELQQMTGYEIGHQLPNHLLMKVEKATMAQSVEARLPFLDRDVVDFVYGLPAAYKYSGGGPNARGANDKRLLRHVARGLLPASIVNRPKFGMLLPIGDVLADNRERLQQELLGTSESPVHAYVSRREIRRLFAPPRLPWQWSDRQWFLWKLYLLHVWMRWWVQREPLSA